MSLRPGGERRISAAIKWMETAVEAKKKNAPGMIIFRMHFEFNSIIINSPVIEKKSPIRHFPGAKTLAQAADCLEVECDILVPAALENQIHQDNAKKIRARVIAEAANGPVTFDADRILTEAGRVVIPDLYLNAGGVIVSYFEWTKNLSKMRFGRLERRLAQTRNDSVLSLIETATGSPVPERMAAALRADVDEVNLVRSGLEDTMRTAHDQIRDMQARNEQIPDLRTAAYVTAIGKIARYYTEYAL